MLTYFMELDPQFPLDEVLQISSSLEESGILVPGYTPPDSGLLDITEMHLAKDIENIEILILPDRNIVSCIAQIARQGIEKPVARPIQLAAELMAYAQCLNLQFEPSIAYHELAHTTDNENAYDELRWFRIGDKDQPNEWIDIALGRKTILDKCEVQSNETRNLSFPLSRWRRNYLIALKIAEIELLELTPCNRAIYLFDWLYDRFFFAGPAAIFATMYFAPNAPRRDMIKKLRSNNRDRAIRGIRNAAWDMTHLSDFTRRVNEEGNQQYRYIFATADEALASLAPLLIWSVGKDQIQNALAEKLTQWWPLNDAKALALNFNEKSNLAEHRPPPSSPNPEIDIIEEWTKEAEERIRLWQP